MPTIKKSHRFVIEYPYKSMAFIVLMLLHQKRQFIPNWNVTPSCLPVYVLSNIFLISLSEFIRSA